MALSPKMLAVLQKIEAADAKHFAGLRESAKQDAEVRQERKNQMNAKRKKPSVKVPPPVRVTSTGGATHKQHKDRKVQIPKPPRV